MVNYIRVEPKKTYAPYALTPASKLKCRGNFNELVRRRYLS